MRKDSELLGEECALCRHPLAPGDMVVICPEDGTRHHAHCWQANGNRCTAYGCRGRGEIAGLATEESERAGATEERRRSKVRVLPSSSLGCAQSCLVFSIAIAIILIAVGCFGIWAIADYVMLEVLDLPYRVKAAGPISFLDLRPYLLLLSISLARRAR